MAKHETRLIAQHGGDKTVHIAHAQDGKHSLGATLCGLEKPFGYWYDAFSKKVTCVECLEARLKAQGADRG